MTCKAVALKKIALPAILLLSQLFTGIDLIAFNVEEIGGTLSVNDCVTIALRHNPGHQKVQGGLEVSSANLISSYGQFLPTVNFGYGISEDRYFNPTFVNPEGSVSSFPLSIPSDTTFSHFLDDEGDIQHISMITSPTVIPVPQGRRRFSGGQLLVSESLFQGGRNIFNLMKARNEKEAARQDISSSELGIVYQIHQQYYEVLANRRLMELAREVLEQRKEQLRLAKARYEVGSVTRLDVMQAEIDKGNQENTLMTEENNLKISRMELNRLMGIPLEVEFDMLDAFETVKPDFVVQELLSGAMNRRPDLLGLIAEEKAAEKEIWVQRASYLPSLTFDLYFFRSEQGSGDNPFTFSPENEDTRYALNLDWQFFSGFSRHSSNRIARVDLENTRHDIREKKLLIEKEAKEAILNLESVYQQSLITEKNRHLASENLRLERERYRLGSSSFLDLRTAQVTYIEAETEHINKILEFNTSFAALENATGLKLRN